MKNTNDTKPAQAPTADELLKELKAARRAMRQMMNRLGVYDEGRDIARRAIQRATAMIDAAKAAQEPPGNE